MKAAESRTVSFGKQRRMRVKTEQGLTESGVQNMRTELKRILAQPFFWVFLAGCLFVNGWLLCNYAGQRERVLESVSAEEELGSIDEDSMAGYEERLRRFDSDEEGVLTVGQMLRAAAAMKEELGAEDLADAYMRRRGFSGWSRSWMRTGKMELRRRSLSQEMRIFLNYYAG